MPNLPIKEYLGDAVYVTHDGFGITLTTEDGISVTNKIYIEPDVFTRLLQWHDRLTKQIMESEDDG